MVKVEQVDRECLAQLLGKLQVMDEQSLAEIREGLSDQCEETKIIACHRIEAQAELVECLRGIGAKARSDGQRTFDDCIRDLAWVDDECRRILAKMGEGE